MVFFRENLFFWKNINFLKKAKGSQFAVECDWISKISQKNQNLGFCWKLIRCVIRKIFFSKIAAISKFAVECDWISKNLQKVQKFVVSKKMGFLLTKTFFFKKMMKALKLLQNATEWVRLLKTFES